MVRNRHFLIPLFERSGLEKSACVKTEIFHSTSGPLASVSTAGICSVM